MLGLSLGEMVVLGGIALIAIDPKDLPQVARTLGKFLNELKRATGDLTKNFTDVNDVARSQLGDARKSMNDVFTGVSSGLAPNSQIEMQIPSAPHVDAPSPVELTPDPVEEQLAFQLTNFDDDGSSNGGSAQGHS